MGSFKKHRQLSTVALSASALLAGGCANMSDRQRNSAIGGGLGSLAGSAIGDSKGAAVVGAGVGAMEQATAGTGVEVTQTADNQLKLSIRSDISFDTVQSTIKPNLRPVLDQLAQGLNAEPNTEVRIIGHTDAGRSRNRHIEIYLAERASRS